MLDLSSETQNSFLVKTTDPGVRSLGFESTLTYHCYQKAIVYIRVHCTLYGFVHWVMQCIRYYSIIQNNF